MGCAKSKEALDVHDAATTTGPTSPFPVAAAGASVEKFLIPKKVFRTFPSAGVPVATMANFNLNSSFSAGPEGVQIATAHAFMAFLQQKARSPGDYILYDTQAKARYAQGSLKFSLNPWTSIPARDLENPETLKKMIAKVKGDISGKKILLYGSEPTLELDTNLVIFLQQILKPAEADPANVIILKGGFLEFCGEFPHCLGNHETPLPGPTEILFQPKTGFCLFMSELRTVRTNLEAVRDIHEIHYLVNLSDFPMAGTSGGQSFKGVYEGLQEDALSRGTILSRAVEKLHEISTKGSPVLITDLSGEHNAPVACAWYMVELGWEPQVAMTHVSAMRGKSKKRNTYFDENVIRALDVLRATIPEGTVQARAAAAAVFPRFDDDDNAFDS